VLFQVVPLEGQGALARFREERTWQASQAVKFDGGIPSFGPSPIGKNQTISQLANREKRLEKERGIG